MALNKSVLHEFKSAKADVTLRKHRQGNRDENIKDPTWAAMLGLAYRVAERYELHVQANQVLGELSETSFFHNGQTGQHESVLTPNELYLTTVSLGLTRYLQ